MQLKKRGMLGDPGELSAAVLLFAVFVALLLSSSGAWGTTSVSGTNTSLTIWDTTDSLMRYSGQNITFYANFTNKTSGTPIMPSLGGANCNITFNTTGAWLGPFNMSYDTGPDLYWYNSTFSWKGMFDFNVSCLSNSSFGNEWLNASENYTITNSKPDIIYPLPSVTCYEDSCGTYNFSANCSDVDTNDVLTYSRDANTSFACFSMNINTGIIDLSGCDNSNESVSSYTMKLIVSDNEDASDIESQLYTVIAVNDAPVLDITDCQSASPASEDVLFTCDVTGSDEEDGTQASENLNFTSNTSWFSMGLTTGSVSFTPTNDKVGYHDINISVNDTNGAVDWALLSLQITNVNDPPSITLACYDTGLLNGTNATENAWFNCTLNATDPDTGDTVSFHSNVSWFLMNNSAHSSYDGLGNFSAQVNFTPGDIAVGSHHINISANDSTGARDWQLINFTVFDVPDRPRFLNLVNGTNITAYEYVWLDYPVLGFDNDTYWNNSEYVNFTHNQTGLFDFTYVNNTAARINFMPGGSDSGAYDIRVNATDGAGNAEYVVINLTIYGNEPPFSPNITLVCYDTNATYNSPCYYNLSENVTEPDGDSFNFTDNTTLFDINTTTGELNFTGNDSTVGNHSVRINMTDARGATNFTIVSIEIRNVNDAPALSLMNWTAYRTILFNVSLDGNVSDGDENVSASIFNESFSFGAFNASNTTQSLALFLNMTVNGTIYLVPNQTHIGNHSINITVNDSSGAMDWQVINFTINDYNNPPGFTFVCNNTRHVTENDNVTCWINASDIDSSNLTFDTNTSWFQLNTTAQPINSTNPDASTLVNFTPGGSEVGNHSIKINVTDDEGAYSEIVIDFEVLSFNTAPTINWWRWVASEPTNASTTETDFLAEENSSILFYHTSSDPDADSLTYSWSVDGTENATTANTSYWVPFTHSNDSSFNMTLIISDSRGGFDQQEWNITTINVNIGPSLYKNITNQSWPENTVETLNLSEHFSDMDGDNLSFSYNLTPDCQATNCMTITFSGTRGDYMVTFTSATNWWGITNATVTASDSEYDVTSNSFILNVTYVPPQTQYVYVRTSGGGSSGRSKIAALSMIIDPFVIVEPKKIVKAPIYLVNTGEVALNSINLTAEADGNDIALLLADTFFEKMAVGGNASTYMTINTTNAQKDRYEIRINASVSNPKLNETATIYLETTPTNRTEIDIKIEFVKDLFEDNPECMELMELVFEAEEALSGGNNERARNLTKTAIDNCRDLIRYVQVTGHLPSQSQPLAINLQPLDIVVVFVIAIVVWFVLSRMLRPGRRHRRAASAKSRLPSS